MTTGLPLYFFYFFGIAIMLLGLAAAAVHFQATGVRLQRPKVKSISEADLPPSLLPVYQTTAIQLSELGFEPHHFALSQDVIAHQHDKRWCMVMVNRKTKVFAEIAPATTFLAMPGVEVDFWSITQQGKVLLTVNAKSHTLLGEMPGVQVHDPLKDTLNEQYQAHLQQQPGFLGANRLVIPNEAVFIKLQQKLLDAYFLGLIKKKIIVSTGNNLFRVSLRKSFGLAKKYLKGESLIQKLIRNRESKNPANRRLQSPVDAEVYSYLRLHSVYESRTRGLLGKILIFGTTLLISYFVLGLAFTFTSVFVLLGVILLHELGHILAMHAFKYRDLQILFLPFLGAASTGKKDNVAVWKQVIVYLMGPLPGIILGLVLILLNKNWNAPMVYETAMIMLVINYVNLLPIMPMDGGHIVRLTIMERFPTGKLIFLGLSIAAFAAGAVFLAAPILWVLAIAMLAAFPMARRETAILKLLNEHNATLETLDTPSRLRKIFEALKLPQFSKLNFSGKYHLITSLSEVVLQQRHNSLQAAMSLTGVYLAVLLLTPPAILVSTVGLDKTTSRFHISALSSSSPSSKKEVPAKDWDAEIRSTKDSHERFEMLIQASQYYSATSDIKRSENYLKQAEGMATTLNDDDMTARVYHAYALYYQSRGEYPKAESYLERAIDIGMKRSDKNYLQIASHFQALASLKFEERNLKDYESDLITALLFAKKIPTPDQRYIIGDILGQLLDLYYQQNHLDTAKVLLDQTLKDFDKKDSAPFTSFIVEFAHMELGWIYTSQAHYSKAVKQFQLASAKLTHHRKKSHSGAKAIDPMEKANLHLDMAVAHYKHGDLTAAQNELHTAEELVKHTNFDSLSQYIDTYYTEDNDAPKKNDAKDKETITSLLSGADTNSEIAGREASRWRLIYEMNQTINNPTTAAK